MSHVHTDKYRRHRTSSYFEICRCGAIRRIDQGKPAGDWR